MRESLEGALPLQLNCSNLGGRNPISWFLYSFHTAQHSSGQIVGLSMYVEGLKIQTCSMPLL